MGVEDEESKLWRAAREVRGELVRGGLVSFGSLLSYTILRRKDYEAKLALTSSQQRIDSPVKLGT